MVLSDALLFALSCADTRRGKSSGAPPLRTPTNMQNDLADAFRPEPDECRVRTNTEVSRFVVGDSRDLHPVGQRGAPRSAERWTWARVRRRGTVGSIPRKFVRIRSVRLFQPLDGSERLSRARCPRHEDVWRDGCRVRLPLIGTNPLHVKLTIDDSGIRREPSGERVSIERRRDLDVLESCCAS